MALSFTPSNLKIFAATTEWFFYMACDFSNHFATNAGVLIKDIAAMGRISSPWIGLFKRNPWPDESGDEVSRVIFERSGHTGGAGWTAVDQAENQCAPTPARVAPATTERSASLESFFIESDPLCVTNVRSMYKFRQQVSETKDNFAAEIRDIWIKKNRDEYRAALTHHLVATTAFSPATTNADYGAVRATSPLTQRMLDEIRFTLMRNNAGEKNAYAKMDGAPVFTVIMSPEQQQWLFQGNTRINEDIRYAKPSDLLKPYGVERSYAGFFHVIDMQAPRYNFESGAYHEQAFYENSAATHGTKEDPSDEYMNADYEEVFVFLPEVVEQLIPVPLSSMGADTKVDPWDFMGVSKWMNEYDPLCNRMKMNGWWAAALMAAYMPLKPQYGFSIMVKRCPASLELVTCTSDTN